MLASKMESQMFLASIAHPLLFCVDIWECCYFPMHCLGYDTVRHQKEHRHRRTTRAIAPLTSLGIFTSLAFMTKITFYHYIMFYDTITCYHLSLLSITRYLFHLTPLTFLLQKISPIKWSQSLIIWELHEMDARARLQCQAMHSFAISHFQLIDSLLKLPPCNYQVWISCLQFLLTGKKMSV